MNEQQEQSAAFAEAFPDWFRIKRGLLHWRRTGKVIRPAEMAHACNSVEQQLTRAQARVYVACLGGASFEAITARPRVKMTALIAASMA